jgi:hypothetical protein
VNPVLLNLAHSGAIPEGLSLRVNVSSQYSDGSVLYLYYYNAETGKLEDESKEYHSSMKDFVDLDFGTCFPIRSDSGQNVDV